MLKNELGNKCQKLWELSLLTGRARCYFVEVGRWLSEEHTYPVVSTFERKQCQQIDFLSAFKVSQIKGGG